jgi:single-strand DNA-binding protein
MRYTPSGRPVTSFSIVTSHTWVSSNQETHKETDWFNVVAWGSLAEACKQSLVQGQRIYVEGRIRNRRWNDESNVSHLRAEVVAQGVIPLDT